MPMRRDFLMVTDPIVSYTSRYEHDFVSRIRQRARWGVIDSTEEMKESLRDESPLAVILFRRFRGLEREPSTDWYGFDGLRALLDFDAFHDFTTWGGAPGRWQRLIRDRGFDLLVCSGLKSAQHFAEAGIPPLLIHKGYEPTRFHDLGRSRSGVGTFGTAYRSRMALNRALGSRRVPVENFACRYEELNDRLNDMAGVVTTVMGAHVRFGRAGRLVERLRPGTVLRFEPAPEPMAKHFEACGAGCAVITDETLDLEFLGFRDEVTTVMFSSLDEGVERTRHYLDNPDDLRRIGTAAAELVRDRHTWDHRIDALERGLDDALR